MKVIPSRRRGAALLAIIIFVAVLTLMLLSYLIAMQMDQLSTNSYSHSIRAEQIGLGGLQEIISDLTQEIDAGSVSGSAYTVNGKRIYLPLSNYSSMPARIGFIAADYSGTDPTLLPPTLLRVSRATDPFFTAPNTARYDAAKLPINYASPASSTVVSANGRILTAERWNKPLLMPDAKPAVTGIQVPDPFVAKPPDWIYVTRTGRRVCTDAESKDNTLKNDNSGTNTNAVIGRYAFVMYDQGGLLDINVAGYSNAPTAMSTAILGGKSYLSYADLTAMGTSSLTAAQVNILANWRNAGGMSANGGNFSEAVKKYGKNGFMKFEPGDNPILGRQDLIEYYKSNVSKTNLNPLANFGTFSRTLNAPSWTPTQNANAMTNSPGAPSSTGTNGTGNIYAYKDRAETPAAANRNLPNIRLTAVAANFTMAHYDDEGTSVPYTLQEGDPLLQRRFSLGKLAWLTHSGTPPTGVSTTAVKACFGLTWDNSAKRWAYDHGNPSRIKTLAEVAGEQREPDFFELLKAVILSGSLGKNPGAFSGDGFGAPSDFSKGAPTYQSIFEGPVGVNFQSYQASSDQHIIQIGANIIDQADADGYPTAIYFKAFTDSSDLALGPVNMSYGTENLPYLSKLFNPMYEQEAGKLSGWFQPELWSPHQAPATTPTNRPTDFRITLYGSVLVYWSQANVGTNLGTSTPISYSGTEAGSHLYFSNTGLSTSPFYKTPDLLTTLTSEGGEAATDAKNKWKTSTFQTSDGGNPFLAIFAGAAPYTPKPPPTGNAFVNAWCTPVNGVMSLALEYKDTDGTYRPYNWMSRLAAHYYSSATDSWTTGTPPAPSHPSSRYHFIAPPITGIPVEDTYFVRPDPRTDRFGSGHNEEGHAGASGGSPRKKNTFRPNKTAHYEIARGMPRRASGFTYDMTAGSDRPSYTTWWNDSFYLGDWAENQSNNLDGTKNLNTAYYASDDGLVRPGDGFRRDVRTDGTATGHGSVQMLNDQPTPLPSGTDITARKPVILNRPFRSVGELGFVFRDEPFKSLDFFSRYSADAALLDVFSIADEPTIAAGQINPNSAPVAVLQAVLASAFKKEADPANVKITPAETTALASAIVSRLNSQSITSPDPGSGPIQNRAELVTRLSDVIANVSAAMDTVSVGNRANKAYVEAPLRALAGVTNTRTWNLMIDIIAQSGRIAPNAQHLTDFQVEGERRYWLHIAIDRYTGKIVDQQLEAVYE